MLVTIHSAQHNLVNKSEAESKYFINFPILQPEQVLLIHVWCKMGRDMQCFLMLSFADIFQFKLFVLASLGGFVLFFKDLWKDFSQDISHYAKCQIKVMVAVPKELTSFGSNYADFLHTPNYRWDCWHCLSVRFLNTSCLKFCLQWLKTLPKFN